MHNLSRQAGDAGKIEVVRDLQIVIACAFLRQRFLVLQIACIARIVEGDENLLVVDLTARLCAPEAPLRTPTPYHLLT